MTGREVLFKGLIDGMEIQNRDGASAGFLVTGHSHTIAMEDLKHSRIHLGKTLKQIAEESLKGQAYGLFEPEALVPVYGNRIASSHQSGEHTWKYLTRLAKNYGEWLYWDGTRLQFGRLKDSKTVLVNGVHLKSFGMGARLLSNKSALSGFDYNSAMRIKGQQEKTDASFNDSLMNTALTAQNQQYPRKMASDIAFHRFSSNEITQEGIDRANGIQTSGTAAAMVTYKAESHVPVNVGHIITVKNKTVSHHLIVVSSEITSAGVGNLSCMFEAVPVDAKQPPYTNTEKHGKAKAQPAAVIDNNDPQGMGRVRVRYFWGNLDNESDWLRVQTPHAGSGKGFYFIPEIGEEVRVCFEGGNPDRGFVSGSNFNGKEISGYGDAGNNLKAIHTRSGTKILLNDGEGSVFIEDASGNTVHLDGRGNVKVTAPKTMTLNATDLNINVSDSFNIAVGNQMTTAVMQKILLNTPFMQQLIADYYHVQSGKALLNSMQEMKLESPEMYVAGQQKLMMHSDESAVLNSQNTVELKGKSGNKLSNTPAKYVITEQTIEAKAVVVFRPLSTWQGEFGFDWMRTGNGSDLGQTTIVGDVDYKTIIGFYRRNDYNTSFVGDLHDANNDGVMDLYESLKREYQNYKLANKLDTYNKPIDYLVPILSLYKHEQEASKSLAVLELQIEVLERPDELILEYDSRYFDITQYVDPLAVTVTVSRGASPEVPSPYINENPNIKKIKLPRAVTSTGTFNTYEIQIECVAPFNTAKEICAYTIMADSDPTKTNKIKKLAGKLKVMPNDKTKRKIKKIVLVNVKTDIDSDGVEEEGFSISGMNETAQKAIIKKISRQAMIDPVFKVEELDLSSKGAPNTTVRDTFNRKYVSGGRLKCYYMAGSTPPANWKSLSDYLYDKLKAKSGIGTKYESYIRIFYMAHAGYGIDAGGTEFPPPSRGHLGGYTDGAHPNNIVMVSMADTTSSAHEVLHSLRLPHTFESKNHKDPAINAPTQNFGKHSFKFKSTENIMDYGACDKQYFLYYWQAKTANEHASPEPLTYIPTP